MEITTTRQNPLIDPSLHVWHGEVAAYLFLGGLVAGLMILLGAYRLWKPERPRSQALARLPWLVPVLLSVGMLFLWLDLANRLNAFRFYLILRPETPMSWGAWILLAVYPVSLAFAWNESPAAWRRRALARWPRLAALARCSEARQRPLAFATMNLGILLAVYTGILLGAFAARPLWNSPLLGPLFLASGLSSGAAFILLFGLEDEERRLASIVDMGVIGAELGLIALWLLGLAVGGLAAQSAARLFFGGPYTAAFWTLVVALGLVIPFIGEAIEYKRRATPGRATALFVLAGGFALRWIVVFAGQAAGWVGQVAGK
ncbi:nitrite reductase [bacterium]|nr:nitrite reductase [bacterium]